MKRSLVLWVERYFYNPTPTQKLLSFLLLPLTLLYCGVVFFRFLLSKPEDLGIKVVSVGNLIVGGSGKTPLVIAIAKRYRDAAIVLRGYSRESKGLYVVKNKEELLCDVKICGDEALVYASKLKSAIIIVSEDRKEGILKAKELGASFVLLDDGYSKHHIKKLDLLIQVPTPNSFCLPSGAYRERLWKAKKALFVQEGRDFVRRVVVENPTKKMVFLTAIARPQRVDPYLPKEVFAKYYFEDHHTFTHEEIAKIVQREQPTSLLVTLKDYVKLERFGFPLSLLDLELDVDEALFGYIDDYLEKL